MSSKERPEELWRFFVIMKDGQPAGVLTGDPFKKVYKSLVDLHGQEVVDRAVLEAVERRSLGGCREGG